MAGKAGRVIDPMTYIAKGAGAGLSKIGDIAKGLKGVGNIDIPTLPDGSVHLPSGHLMDPNGNLISPNGSIDTTPVHYETNTPSVPHGTTPTLPAHWTTQGAPTPSYAGSHAGADGAAHTVDNAGHYDAPNAGHYNAPTHTTATAASHTPGGAFDTPPPGAYDHAPSGSPYGHAPSGSPYGHTPSGSPYDHAPSGSPYDHSPSGSAYDHTPGTNPYAQTPSGSPYGHAPSPSAYDHAPSPSAYDQAPTTTPHEPPTSTPHTGGNDVPGGVGHPGATTPWYHQGAAAPTHEVPTTTPHTGGHDVPGTGGHDVPGTSGHGTPDAPHGTGHDTHGGGHTDDASHGVGHGDDGVGHADDAAHAGDHADVGDVAAHHGTDGPVAPGHQGADVPGSGAGEPFRYQPHLSVDDFNHLATDAEKHAVAEAELARGTNPAPSVSNEAGLAYGNAYWDEFMRGLDPETRSGVVTYTGSSYTPINNRLRFGTDAPQHILDTIKNMDEIMDARPVPEDVMVVRGTGVDHIKIDGQPLKSPTDMQGLVFDDKAFTSTALGKTPPPPFDKKPVWMHLRVPKDTPALWLESITQVKGERELLLAKGSEYKVTRVFQDTMGKWHVYGEILPRPKP